MSESSKKILIVEDEKPLARTLELEFRTAGWTVLETDSIHHALKMQGREKLDLIVTDNRLPGGSGLDLLDQTRKQDLSLPIVLISAFADLELHEVYARGAEAFFAKPFSLEALTATAERLIQPPKARWSVESLPSAPRTVELRFADFLQAERSRKLRMGRGGFFLSLDEDLPAEGEMLRFDFSFDFGLMRRLSGLGQVRWSREAGMAEDLPAGCGVSFEAIDARAINTLIQVQSVIVTRAFIPSA